MGAEERRTFRIDYYQAEFAVTNFLQLLIEISVIDLRFPALAP